MEGMDTDTLTEDDIDHWLNTRHPAGMCSPDCDHSHPDGA